MTENMVGAICVAGAFVVVVVCLVWLTNRREERDAERLFFFFCRNWQGSEAVYEVTPNVQGKGPVPIDPPVRATVSLCCCIVRGGWQPQEVMHDGLCRDRHGGHLGRTYYLTDSGLTSDEAMRYNAPELTGAEGDRVG